MILHEKRKSWWNWKVIKDKWTDSKQFLKKWRNDKWKRQIAIFFRCTNGTVFWQTVCKDILKMLRDKINRMNKQCSKREGGGWMDGWMTNYVWATFYVPIICFAFLLHSSSTFTANLHSCNNLVGKSFSHSLFSCVCIEQVLFLFFKHKLYSSGTLH